MRARFAIQLAGSHALRGPSRAVTRAEIPELKPLIAAMQEHVAKEKAQGLCALRKWASRAALPL